MWCRTGQPYLTLPLSRPPWAIWLRDAGLSPNPQIPRIHLTTTLGNKTEQHHPSATALGGRQYWRTGPRRWSVKLGNDGFARSAEWQLWPSQSFLLARGPQPSIAPPKNCKVVGGLWFVNCDLWHMLHLGISTPS